MGDSREDALKKAVDMAVFFDAVKFNKIQQGLKELEKVPPDLDKAETKIRAAVKAAGMSKDAEDWLWNYLKEYKEGFNRPWAADTGW